MSDKTNLQLDDAVFEPKADLDKVQTRAFGVGVAALTAVVAVGFWGGFGSDFFRAWLVGWLFALGIAAGMFGLNMINHLSGGDWGVSLRRVFEASGRTLPFFILFGLPIAFGLEQIYPWAVAGAAEGDALLAHKRPFLNAEMYFACSVGYILIWSIFAYATSAASKRFAESGDAKHHVMMQRLAAAGLIAYVLTGTLASVHWVMSLDPHWFSSLFGAAFVEGHGLSAFAFSVPVLIFLSKRNPFQEWVPARVLTKLFHDYGKLMLAFTALWAYLMFSQFLIIWSGDLPEEVTWYLDRATSGWQLVSVLLVLGQFVIPFILLLSQDLKKKPGRLVLVAFWILLMRFFDLFWQVAPSISRDHVVIPWLDLLVAVGIGGLWLGLLIVQVKNRTMMPVREPALQKVVAHG